jgi:hypothetical protein
MGGPIPWERQRPGEAESQLQQTLERERRRDEARAAIDGKHAELAGAPGAPASDVVIAGDGGFMQRYQHGALYWHPASGAHHVYGAIYQKYVELGGPGGGLGYPLTDEKGGAGGAGRYNRFQHGSIAWHPQIGAHEVHGDIHAKWASLGHESYGYPFTDESPAARGGRFNHFRAFRGDGGFEDKSIHWTPDTGAHETHGLIRDKWAEMGWEHGYLGFPISDEMDLPEGLPMLDGRVSRFQNGIIVWTPGGGAVASADERKFSFNVSKDTVSGWCELTIKADGWVSYKGHLHESGALNHHYYMFTAIQLKGAPSGPILVAHEGTVRGTLGFGSRDDDWDLGEMFPPAVELWPLVVSSTEQLTKMTVTTGPIEILEGLAMVGLVNSGAQSGFLLLSL